MPKYLYQAVAGAGVFGKAGNIGSAKLAVRALRAGHWGGPYITPQAFAKPKAEVERVMELPNHARRYWRWRGGRWSVENHYDPAPADLAKWD